MSRYRRRVNVVEAFQMTRENRISNRYWPVWMYAAWKMPNSATGAVYPSTSDGEGMDKVMANTLAGAIVVQWDSWIIHLGSGQLVVMNDADFREHYEEVCEAEVKAP